MTDDHLQEQLTEEQKQEWDTILRNLAQFLDTAEGCEMLQKLKNLSNNASKHVTKASTVDLTPNEQRALNYIKKELKKRNSPSVREITKAVGLRSSRSGHKILRVLRERNLVPNKNDATYG